MQKITTFLAYDTQAEEAAKLYTSVFKNSKILSTTRYGEGAPPQYAKGTVMTVTFQLEGQTFVALNGGSHFKFSDGISLSVSCETQEEIDHLWEKLSEGGKKGPCGWLTDRFGVSWQIVPSALPKLVGDKDPAKAKRAMQAMLQMTKLDINALQRAHDQG
jgi:predicted 3-demethylubiquinone-9 3-methyltransferase (glyoxalase superfamily)